MVRVLECFREVKNSCALEMPGVHLEGPYLALEMCGGQAPEIIRPIDREEYNFIYEYFVEDLLVSEAEYNAAVNSAFNFLQAVRLDENAVSYDEIIRQLQND